MSESGLDIIAAGVEVLRTRIACLADGVKSGRITLEVRVHVLGSCSIGLLCCEYELMCRLYELNLSCCEANVGRSTPSICFACSNFTCIHMNFSRTKSASSAHSSMNTTTPRSTTGLSTQLILLCWTTSHP